MASCHAWNQPSGNVAVEKKKKKHLWGVVSKRAVAMATQWRARRCWMLVSMGHRTSDRVWSSRGCNDCREVCWQAWWASLLQPGPWNLGSPLSLKASFFGPRSKKKSRPGFFIHRAPIFQACSSYADVCLIVAAAWFLMYERKEEMHPKMCIQMKYSKLLMKYSVSLEFLWATPPAEPLLRK